jgi:uncharacterized protein
MPGTQKGAFLPPPYLRASVLQTVLASLKLRAVGISPMESASREVILTLGGGVRLQGFHSQTPMDPPRGMAILLHGWEGSARSTYILHTGQFLYSRGYDVFRLNLRDHGDTHHLNEGLFYCTLLEEVFEGVGQAVSLSRGGPVILAGFSLGGNFSLRIASRLEERPLYTLSHVLAVSPALNPARATDAIDAHPLLHWYFMRKWKASLRRKQELFPHLYHFEALLSLTTIRGITRALIEESGLYPGVDEYFRGYTIGTHVLEGVRTPVTIVHSQDDPAVPARDFLDLHIASHHRLIIHKYGGHNGFLYGITAPSWYEEECLRILDQGGTNHG